MISSLQRVLNSDSLAPHGFCLLWRPELIWTHVISDTLIGLAYYSIPMALAWFVWKRRALAFGWVSSCFTLFILACGTHHFVSIRTLWNPDYGADGAIKAVTAIASILTALSLRPLLPKALALPSPILLRQANEALTQQIRERDSAVTALRRETAERLRAEEMLWQAQKPRQVPNSRFLGKSYRPTNIIEAACELGVAPVV